MGLKYGTTITTMNQPLQQGSPAGYNGTDFDLLGSSPDNADAMALLTGGQAGGAQRVLAESVGFNGTTMDRIRSAADNADGVAVVTLGTLRVFAEHMAFNGTSYDRWRTNQDNIVLANLSGATTSGQSADQTNYNGRGCKVFINITALTGTSITFTIQGKDPVSSTYYTILAGAAQSGTGTVLMSVYPALTASANVTVNDVLPRTWRLSWVISSATVTATAGGIVIL